MAKKKIKVQDHEISITIVNNQDYFSLTDMAIKFGERPDELIRGWIRNRNTLEYLEAWEKLYNKNFKPGQMDGIKNRSGLNTFRPTVRQFIDESGAIGIQSQPGRYGGTYAHKDIAFNFATWLSAPFQLYMVREFDRLKTDEAKRLNKPWNLRRELSKLNYSIHTEAVRESLPLMIQRTKKEAGYFATEADLLNEVVFGMTAKQWRTANPKLKGNIRDHATTEQLHVLANLEVLNAKLIELAFTPGQRRTQLRETAEKHLSIIQDKKRLR